LNIIFRGASFGNLKYFDLCLIYCFIDIAFDGVTKLHNLGTSFN